MRNLNAVIFVLIILIYSCITENEVNYDGTITFEFEHLVNGKAAEFDQMIYRNEVGNEYEITNIQWFVSEVTLIGHDGIEKPVSASDWIHYIDTDLPETHRWTVLDGIKPGEYEAIRFIFGIRGEKNMPYMFTDPPESNMIWPYFMGGDEGGYHYMKLNGFWITPSNERMPYNFHIGVGQQYDENKDITGFIQNWFEVRLPYSSFSMPAGGQVDVKIQMNIENWFKGPRIYDHNEFGGSIMNNQAAMGKIHDNGIDVFSVVIE
jgi:hypothetical protein